jgi:hypothetical protein
VNVVYAKIVAINDQWTEETMERQLDDPNSRYDGGVTDPVSGIPLPNHGVTPSVMAIWSASLINPDSRYYHDERLLGCLERASHYMLKQQHSDGTISPGWTNYHSPPDTGFIVVGMAQYYRLLAAHAWEPIKTAAAPIRLFLERTVPAMLTGGCHTPNHRWVMTAALASLNELFPDEALVDRAEEWLAEGMDLTEDGEWTERSNGIYNAVSDIMLFHTARLLHRPELLEPARRNLHMMLYLVHPSGEIVTDYSGRQDFGKIHRLSNYFLIYRLMAWHDRDPLFAAMSDYAAASFGQPGSVYNNEAIAYQLFTELRSDDLPREPLPERYTKIINGSYPTENNLALAELAGHQFKISHSRMHTEFGAPLVRYRNDDTSITIMTKAASFFALRHGKIRLLGIKLSTSFTPGDVQMEQFEAMNGCGYRLRAVMEKGYSGPIPRVLLPESAKEQVSPWYLLPHQNRPMTHPQKHTVEVEIVPVAEDGWDIRVHSEDMKDVFMQVCLIFGEEGQFSGGDLEPIGPYAQFWKDGAVTYTIDGDKLEISAGTHEHRLPGVRDFVHPSGCQTLLVNVMTPFDRTFELRLS